MHCNRYKGPNVAGIDPETGELTRLFLPRVDDWNSHFLHNGAEISPLSPIGRVTVSVLFMNERPGSDLAAFDASSREHLT
jgi:hypothetical protein